MHGGLNRRTELEEPSAWVRRWTHLVPAGGAGAGRGLRLRPAHALVRAARPSGDRRRPRAQEAIAAVAGLGEAVLADIENGPWPFTGRTFAGVVVTNYLWRPLFPAIVQSVAPGGVLIYETFAAGNETVGKPSRPDFLLQPGELLRACQELRVVAYEDGFLDEPPRFVQRIAAVRPAGDLAALPLKVPGSPCPEPPLRRLAPAS